jgi:ABC-type bacteriocin/lantibiotic exporter with double-glycine peptidase domain
MSLNLEVIPQISHSHCGPASLQMLLAFHGVKTNQDEIVATGRVKSTILRHGMRPSKLAYAVSKLHPTLRFWFKNQARVTDLEVLIKTYKVPVGINWQVLAYKTVVEEKKKDPDGDKGHYSVVVGINRNKDTITIADPYSDFAPKLRRFSLKWFQTRWWDAARDIDPKTKTASLLRTKRFMFVLAPPSAPYLKTLTFLPADQLDSLYTPEKDVKHYSTTFPYKTL